MNPDYRPRSNCTACGAELRRVPRQTGDGASPGSRRYGCVSKDCGWQGLLPRMPARRRAPLARRWRSHLRRALAPALVATALGTGVAVAAWLGLRDSPTVPTWAAGDHHDGMPLPPTHPLLLKVQHTSEVAAGAGRTDTPAEAAAPAGAPLGLRRACVWGKPGRDPYRGTVEQALNMAALPPEVVREIARQVRAQTPADQLVIANDGIVATASGRRFNAQNVAMTYGMTLCLGTKVNFAAGHTEGAALYEAADHAGRIYAVMVPKVCGNVSVLGQLPARPGGAEPAGRGLAPVTVRFLPEQLEAGPGLVTADAGDSTHAVPLPGTLVLVLAGLAALWGSRRPR